MSDSGETSKKMLQAAFGGEERTTKRNTLWLPILTSTLWLGSGVLGVYNLHVWEAGDMIPSYALLIVFAIFQIWVFWARDARYRTLNMKYDVATGFLDHLVEYHDWKWGESTEPGSVALRLGDDDEEDTSEEK